MRKSLAFRLYLGIAVIMAIFMVTGLASIGSGNSSLSFVVQLMKDAVPMEESVNRMEQSVQRQVALVRAFINAPNPVIRMQFDAERQEFTDAHEMLSRNYRSFLSCNVDVTLASTYYDLILAEDQILRTVLERETLDPVQDQAAWTAKGARISALEVTAVGLQTKYCNYLDVQVRAPINAYLGSKRLEAEDRGRRSLILFYVFSALALVFGAGVGLVVIRGIRRPISELSAAMWDIAGGNRGSAIASSGTSEFSILEESFNQMIEKLGKAERELMSSYYEQRRILDTIPVGLLTIDRGGRIGTEYSSAVEALFGRKELSGLSVLELLYGTEEIEAARPGFERFLRQLFENSTADPEFLNEINPVAELRIKPDQGDLRSSGKVLAISFERIYDGLSVQGVLMTVADRSAEAMAERALLEANAAHKRETDSISAILSVGPGPLNDFLSETRSMIVKIREDCRELTPERTNACFRFLHSIKGSAGSLGIDAVAAIAHEAEDLFDQMRAAGGSGDAGQLFRVNVLLGKIGEELDLFESLVSRLRDALSRLGTDRSTPADHEDLGGFISSLTTMVSQLEASLSKTIHFVPEVRIDSLPRFRDFRNVIIHLVRNAADHGLEDSYERLSSGKSQEGTIRLGIFLSSDATMVQVEVEDDGHGLDLVAIEKKARSAGLLVEGESPDRSRLLSCMFMPGFSTKAVATEISGRGVGLDLVRELVSGMRGRISVSSQAGKGTCFRISVPLAQSSTS